MKKLNLTKRLYDIAIKQSDMKPEEIQTPDEDEQTSFDFRKLHREMQIEKKAKRPKPKGK